MFSLIQKRHIGDLGNINTGSSGRTVVDIHDNLAVMGRPHSINGRAIVIHKGMDELKKFKRIFSLKSRFG